MKGFHSPLSRARSLFAPSTPAIKPGGQASTKCAGHDWAPSGIKAGPQWRFCDCRAGADSDTEHRARAFVLYEVRGYTVSAN